MVFRLWLQRSPRLLCRAFLLVGGAEMKKILASFLLFSFFSLSAATEPLDPDPQVDAVLRVLQVLNSWADQYPQCYKDVADIKATIAYLRTLLDSSFEQLFYNFDLIDSDLDNIFNVLSNIDNNSNSLLQNSYSITSYMSDLFMNQRDLYSFLNGELPLSRQLLSDIFTRLPDLRDVNVMNFSDLKDILKELFNEIIVNAHCTLASDASFNINAQFDFDYDYFSPIIGYVEKANKGTFSLNKYTRYIPRTWLYNDDDSMDSLVSAVDSSDVGRDMLDFLCSCGNALVAQNQDISMLLCQILGFFKSGHEDMNELKQLATSAADGASQDLDSLKTAFHASSLEDVAAQYFVDLSIDDHFDTDFLGFGHGSGSSCPDFIDIGPIPFSKIHSSMTDYTLHFSTAGLKSFFDICRQCFTVVWYLFFLTICIFLARFGWAFFKPILRTLTNVLNW